MTVHRSDNEIAAARLSSIVESSDDAIISKDLAGIIISWNRGAELIFGYAADEVIGRPVTILIPKDRINEEPQILSRISQGEKVDHYETVRQRKDGSLLDVSLSISPIYDGSGAIIGASKIARDVSSRKRVDADIARLAAIVESSDDAIISKDLNGIITSWNAGATVIFGYTADEAIGQPVTMLMPPERVDEETGILARIKNGEHIDHYETIRRHKDGRLINISLNVSPIVDSHGVIIGASKIARDITERKAAEAAWRENEIMLRLVEAQEAERYRIARDLHDHLGQQMTALRLKIESMIAKNGHDEAFLTDIQAIRELALQTDRDIGFLSWELRPTQLDELGLTDALRSFVREWSLQYDIAANFEVTNVPETRFPKDVETNLYRVVQEGLNNILKHAQAQNVSVLMNVWGRELILMVEDDGVGFMVAANERRVSNRTGLGLSGMRERVALLKGRLEIESEPGKGTALLVRVPVQPSDLLPVNVHTALPSFS